MAAADIAVPAGRDAAAIVVDRLPAGEAHRARPLIGVLHPGLDAALFEARLGLQQAIGYELFAAFEEARIVGIAGGRPVCTFASGCVFFLDDLVVEETRRGRDIGARLLSFCEEEARRRGMSAVDLNARSTAIGFYERRGYAPAPAPMMRKQLD